jgi:thioredoxin-related protein
MMQQRKYSKTPFVWSGLLLAALLLVCLSGRKPEKAATDGGAVGGGSGGVTAATVGSAMGGNAEAGGRATAEAGGMTSISWMSVEEAAGKLQQEQRPVLIDLYTTWCGWCRQMDKRTYSNKKVAEYLQDKFYPVRVDAETHAVITWGGRTYQFNPQYRSNEFAMYLTHGRLEFPTTIIIVPGQEPQAIPGFMEPKDLELLVKYFGEGAYRTTSFDDYQKRFKASW